MKIAKVSFMYKRRITMSFEEWKNEYAVQITDLYFDYLKDTNQTKEDCTIIEFAQYMFSQTIHDEENHA